MQMFKLLEMKGSWRMRIWNHIDNQIEWFLKDGKYMKEWLLINPSWLKKFLYINGNRRIEYKRGSREQHGLPILGQDDEKTCQAIQRKSHKKQRRRDQLKLVYLITGILALWVEENWPTSLVFIHEAWILKVCYKRGLTLDSGKCQWSNLFTIKLLPLFSIKCLHKFVGYNYYKVFH